MIEFQIQSRAALPWSQINRSTAMKSQPSSGGGLKAKITTDNRDTEHEGLGFENRLILND